MITFKEVANYYRNLHDAHICGCKTSCRKIEMRLSYDFNENERARYDIMCGSYCIGPGRWTFIGGGQTPQQAIDQAMDTLKRWEKDLMEGALYGL